MMNRLNIIEKTHLTWRAWRDVRKGAFYSVSVSSPHSHLDTVGGIPAPSAPDSIPASAFVQHELNELKLALNHIIYGRPTLYWIPIRNIWRRYLLSAPNNILDEIEDFRLRLTAEIYESNKQFIQCKDELNEKKKRYETNNEPHMVQLCINKYFQARKDYANTTVVKYKTVIALLNQKINLISNTNTKLNYTRSKYFRRIRYYYAKAASFSRRLNVILPRDDTLATLGDIDLEMIYTDERNETRKMLEKYMEQISK